MKKVLFTAALLLLAVGTQAQSDTIYFMKKGLVVNKQSIKTTDVDTIVFYKQALPFTDTRDGYVYKTVKIGEQIWMAENLKYLPSVTNLFSEIEPYYYVYGYMGTDVGEAKETENYNIYGALYNLPAALAACPEGWHLPSRAEWDYLVDDVLGGISEAGVKLMEAGDAHWQSPNAEATNESGFTALPGGGFSNRFSDINNSALWWIETFPAEGEKGSLRVLNAKQELFFISLSTKSAASIRCVQD